MIPLSPWADGVHDLPLTIWTIDATTITGPGGLAATVGPADVTLQESGSVVTVPLGSDWSRVRAGETADTLVLSFETDTGERAVIAGDLDPAYGHIPAPPGTLTLGYAGPPGWPLATATIGPMQ